ncbi:hypothetical protein ARMGADRAFT_184703 [Armillaria gallica]|uniref:Uncharacterized protein n=1 Tax=Armillaria gallica TaxID=47427 RepID=A0A2H3DTD6_ARMGA|nr:hypothetical protein ARMGADRAFT_184703 [Armillaria gallica]
MCTDLRYCWNDSGGMSIVSFALTSRRFSGSLQVYHIKSSFSTRKVVPIDLPPYAHIWHKTRAAINWSASKVCPPHEMASAKVLSLSP